MDGTDFEGLHPYQRDILRTMYGLPPEPPRPLPGTGDGPRLQVERRERDGARILVVVTQGERGAMAYVVSHEAPFERWQVGSAHLPTCGSHHDCDGVLAAVETYPPTYRDMVDLGLVGDGDAFAARVAGHLVERPGESGPSSGGIGWPRFAGHRDFTCQRAGRMYAYGHDGGAPTAEAFGFAESGDSALRRPRGRYPGDGPCAGTGALPPTVTRFPPVTASNMPSTEARARALVADALADLATSHRADVSDLLCEGTWTSATYRSLAAPGAAGQRRRQAARLYPALVPILCRRGVMELVDAGRPYEEAIRDALREAMRPAARDLLSVAIVRRLRTLPPDMDFDGMTMVLHACARMPLDWIPRDATGWEAMASAVRPVMPAVLRLGLDLRDLAAHSRRDWARFLPAAPDAPSPDEGPAPAMPNPRPRRPGEMVVGGAMDMADRMASTLVRPLARSLGTEISREASKEVATLALFAGRTLPGIDARQRRWHRNLAAFDAALPSHAALNAWPAAFPPFVAPDGLEVVCLVNEMELRDEGTEGPDSRGRAGLDHCVGGYGRSCYVSDAHVASVRRRVAAGWERVSTVEFQASPGCGEDDVLSVVQHNALSNEEPPPEAEEAVRALLEALAIGDHPLDREALRPRDDEDFVEGYDWRVPGALGQAFAAWSPYMARDLAVDGIGRLAAMVWEARVGAAGRSPSDEAREVGVTFTMTAPPAEADAMFVHWAKDGSASLDIESCGLDVPSWPAR